MARKILLADDSVTAQNMGRRILADAGYDVVTVNNGSAALKKIAELQPELIVLDVYMPGYNGLEVCQRLKESKDTFHIPVLLTVGKLEPFKADEARRVQADAYIVKPFEASELLGALTKLEDRIVPLPPVKPAKAPEKISEAEPPAARVKKDDKFGEIALGMEESAENPFGETALGEAARGATGRRNEDCGAGPRRHGISCHRSGSGHVRGSVVLASAGCG